MVVFNFSTNTTNDVEVCSPARNEREREREESDKMQETKRILYVELHFSGGIHLMQTKISK